jgi:hypothetical protein
MKCALRALFAFLLFASPRSGAAAEVTPAAVCAGCHREQTKDQADSNMAKALSTGAASLILQQHPRLAFSAGRFSYQIERVGDRSLYTVREGEQKLTVPVAWAFGLGSAGQTLLLTLNGKWYESRVSYYKAIDDLDYTLGARGLTPRNLTEALGRETGNPEVAQCFGCHSTNSVQGIVVDFEHMTPGILCESCHGSAAKHVAAMQTGDAKTAELPRLGKLTAEEMFEFCGRCHRTWATIASQGPLGVENVRFQPYRLTNAKCYDAYDQRISCVRCHDPHSHQKQPAGFYDSKCAQCHTAGANASSNTKAKLCPVSAKDCVSCHMPRYEIPGSHHMFTDHEIRIVRAGSSYPN